MLSNENNFINTDSILVTNPNINLLQLIFQIIDWVKSNQNFLSPL